jgi:hypothetical protein
LKGKFALDGAQTRLIPASEADGNAHVFEVQNILGEIMWFSTDSDQTTEAWRNAIQAVVWEQLPESETVTADVTPVPTVDECPLLTAIDAGAEEKEENEDKK